MGEENYGLSYLDFLQNQSGFPISNIRGISLNQQLPIASQSLPKPQLSGKVLEAFQKHYNSSIQPRKQSLLQSKTGQAITQAGVSAISNTLTDKLTGNLFGDSELGQNLGGLFSQGVSSSLNTIGNNIIKGSSLLEGLGKNAGTSLAGTGAGIAANYIGQGINALGGDSMLSRGIGQGIATGLGTVGGQTLSNLAAGKGATNTLVDSIKALKGAKGATQAAGGLSKAAAIGNIAGLAGSIVGTGLQAALGSSKEYGGKYGNVTQTMDTIYDLTSAGVNFIPGVGQAISGAMVLNKGLSNIFGSTDGMCVCAGTKVYTADGRYINIEDLKQEDGILGWNEETHEIRPQKIECLIEPKQKECIEIELDNGRKLKCSIDHPILSNIKEKAESHTINGKRIAYRNWSFRRADELQVGNWVGLANNVDYWGTKEMPNAYLVGMLIGDGTYTYESSCKLWTADPSTWKYLEENNLAELIRQYTPENSNGKYSIENRDYRIINGMQLVKELGIAYQKGKEKTLPKNIDSYNKDSICKLIAGLFDTDGSFSGNKEKNTFSLTLYQSNENLLKEVQHLLYKLGIISNINIRKSSINKMKNGKTINSNVSYRLEITDRRSILKFRELIPINIDYKKNNLDIICEIIFPKKDKDHYELSGARQAKIISIISLGIQTVYNLEVTEDHTYLANDIITHNTVQDAILGSAFMPAPVKWLNMWGSSKTGTFNNQSWQNSEKANSFMGDAFGNLNDRFDQARKEAGKTYGTFSQGAKRDAQKNIDFANYAWGKIMNMADQNILQNIKSQDMASINNQRYAQMIQGGYSPLAIGKQGMKILNNATNHNIGMRLLSGAALIDNKQMILCNVPD